MRNPYGKTSTAGSNTRFLLSNDPAHTERNSRFAVDPEIERERAFIIAFLKDLTDRPHSASMGMARVADAVAEEVGKSIAHLKSLLSSFFQGSSRQARARKDTIASEEKSSL